MQTERAVVRRVEALVFEIRNQLANQMYPIGIRSLGLNMQAKKRVGSKH